MDRTGKRCGRLTAQWPCGRNKHNQIVWLWLCDCGKMKAKEANGKLSCGCLLKESAAKNGRSTKGKPRPDMAGNSYAVIHGGCRSGLSPEYHSYQAAKQRCNDPKCANYKNYGGRGIKFLFTSFEQWRTELGPRPPRMSVDRIDNNDHYRPGNVRWATQSEQSRNQRNPWRPGGGRRCRSQQ